MRKPSEREAMAELVLWILHTSMEWGGGARLPDGKLESELSLGHAEPFGAHPNGQFHRVEKKNVKKEAHKQCKT